MTHGRRVPWSLVAAFVVVATRAVTWSVPLGVDEADYMLRGSEWLQGVRLYADLQSTRPPLLYLIFGLIGALGRAIGIDPGVALRVGSTLGIAVAVGILVFALLPRLKPTAVLAGAVCFVALSASISIEGIDANAEHWMILPWCASVMLFVQLEGVDSASGRGRRAFLAGVLLGIAVLIKQVAITGALLPIILAVVDRSGRRRWWRGAGWYAAGAAFVGALALGGAALNGELAEMVVFGSNTFYAGLPTVVPPFVLALRRLGDYWAIITLILAAGVPVVLAGAVRRIDEDTRRLLLIGLVWLGTAALAAALPGRYYPHYFVLLIGPLALLMSLAVDSVWRWKHQATRALALGLLGTLLALQCAYVAFGYLMLDASRGFRDAGPQVAAAIERHFPQKTRVFVWGGDSAPLVYSGRRPAYSVLWAYYPLKEFGDRGGSEVLGVRLENASDRLLRDFEDQPAEAVVLMRPLSAPVSERDLDPQDDPRFAQMLSRRLKSEYRLVERIPTPAGQVTLWALVP